MEILAFVVILAMGVGGIVVLSRRAELKRRENLRAEAARLGWNFREEVPYNAIPNLERFELFATGRNRKLKNLLTSPAGPVRAVVFDYSYVTGGGKSQHTHRQTVFYASGDDIDLPTFSLSPENIFHRAAAMLGYQDIDLEQHPEFSRLFLLRGQEELHIRDSFSEGVVEFFERHPRTCSAAIGHELLYWRPGRYAKPEELPQLVQEGLELAGRFAEMKLT